MKKERVVQRAYNVLAEDYHEQRTVLKTGSHFYNECLEMPTTLSLLGKVRGKKILDVGCGTGIYAKLLMRRGARVWGIDQSEGMLSIARKYAKGANLRKGSVYRYPFKDNTFDSVLSALVIDHIDDLGRMFREVRRVLKKGGVFVFSAPNPISECRVRVRIGKKEFKIFGHEREGSRVFGDYFTENWRRAPVANTFVEQHHKTYETILQAILKSRMEFVAYKDAKPIKRGKKVDARAYRTFSRIPLFYSVKLRK